MSCFCVDVSVRWVYSNTTLPQWIWVDSDHAWRQQEVLGPVLSQLGSGRWRREEILQTTSTSCTALLEWMNEWMNEWRNEYEISFTQSLNLSIIGVRNRVLLLSFSSEELIKKLIAELRPLWVYSFHPRSLTACLTQSRNFVVYFQCFYPQNVITSFRVYILLIALISV